MNPKYPIYIPSKGRSESRLTSKALERMNVPYFIVIEKEEYEQYSKVIEQEKILVLPFSNVGSVIPARNWIKDHSIKAGFKRHWQLDDNIYRFWRYNNNVRGVVTSGTIFRIAEDFVDRYENVAIAGFQYDFFVPDRTACPPFYTNRRIYSITLMNNEIPHKWRGKFNEDTDISIRVMKDGYCTILFNIFQAKKVQTMTMTGGNNTDEIYQGTDKRKEFAESLKRQHPDIVKVVWRYNRWHHQVDYSQFKKNKLILKKGIQIKQGIDNYGMVLKELKKGEHHED